MTPESAELAKYASNAFLAVKLSYANSVADLCARLGANVDDVTRSMGADPRIGATFLRPGPGWGGSRTAGRVGTEGFALVPAQRRRPPPSPRPALHHSTDENTVARTTYPQSDFHPQPNPHRFSVRIPVVPG
jgi:hypothetical protein